MSKNELGSRLDFVTAIASGEHPVIRAAFWPRPDKSRAQPEKWLVPEVEISPIMPVPHPYTLTPEQKKGDRATRKLIKMNEHTGGPIIVYDGYYCFLDNEKGQLLVMVDSKEDPFMTSIINRGQMLINADPPLSTDEVLFGLSLLMFGNWQRFDKLEKQRFSFNSVKINKPAFKKQRKENYLTRAYLGELVWNTQFQTQSCSLVSLGMQVAGQALIPDITWHHGQAARFSAHYDGAGLHAWSLVANADGSKTVLDLTNFPSNIVDQIYNRVSQNVPIVDLTRALYAVFKEKYGGFPRLVQDRFPPTMEQYDDLHDGTGNNFTPLLAARHSMAYWSDEGTYLGSCRLPSGYDS